MEPKQSKSDGIHFTRRLDMKKFLAWLASLLPDFGGNRDNIRDFHEDDEA